MNIRNVELRRDALLKRLKAHKPLLSGSVVCGEWKCKIKGCRCQRGKLHSAYTLTWKEKKKTKTLYIPVDLREKAQEWNEEYKKIKELIDEISELTRILIRSHVKRKRGRKKHA